ncbi:replication initiation protein RepM [uncultured Acinetobacter sp.]|uniref:replication initiation protein RepM n=1 Tax=uncultured Acinetobacter sp. TaxID=165433 RepID=UPI0026331AF7|nr:replication initiation protein RepM [uncultured Acinetobacter sp.]
MTKDLVVKTNRLNTALQNLTLPELRIVQLAIVAARETGKGLNTDTPLRIDAMRYAEVFDTTRQNSYMIMKEAEDSLFNRRFSFIDTDGRVVKSRWIQRVKYLDNEGAIELVFTMDVVKGITRIDGAEEFFTQYLLSQTAVLKSVYSVRLYELLTQWRSAKQTPLFDLDMFRGQMGIADNEYKRMDHLKKRVLDLAVEEINSKTDLEVSYEQCKRGRVIIGFLFKVRKKTNEKKILDSKSEKIENLLSKLSDKQIMALSNQLAADVDFGSRYAYVGENFHQFSQRIKNEIINGFDVDKYKIYLNKFGIL